MSVSRKKKKNNNSENGSNIYYNNKIAIVSSEQSVGKYLSIKKILKKLKKGELT